MLRMKTSTLARNGVSTEVVDLIGRLVEMIAWPARRRAMGDVVVTLLDGKQSGNEGMGSGLSFCLGYLAQ
jgi:hypothetical protein